VKIFISDDQGHSASHTIDVGPVPVDGSVDVDETFPWPYIYITTPKVTVTYDIHW